MLNEPTKDECLKAIEILEKSINYNVPDILILDSWSQRKGTMGVVKLQFDPNPDYEENADKIIRWLRSSISGSLFDKIKSKINEE